MAQTNQLAQQLNSVAIHLVRRLRRADESLGITPARLSALSVLVFGGPCTLTELAAAEQVAGPTMSRIVAALEEAPFVELAPDRLIVRDR
ncbi:MAG: MarR family transcriptional regulator [Actinobacteria bacterium]|nr:MarR family transcriptional regulator [Actinomycetota bacterium]